MKVLRKIGVFALICGAIMMTGCSDEGGKDSKTTETVISLTDGNTEYRRTFTVEEDEDGNSEERDVRWERIVKKDDGTMSVDILMEDKDFYK